jgi:outer membrane protein assembly factor BamA
MPGHRLVAVLVYISLPSLLWTSCPDKQDHRQNKNSGVLITDFVITGTQSLSSSELADLEGKLTDSCFDEDSEQLAERIRAAFQDRGYFTVEVKNVRIKPTDTLGVPKPVTLEAEVAEGLRYKLAEVKIAGNHAFSSDRLRRQFPLKRGEFFQRAKIARGLESLQNLYSTDGFLDFAAIPETQNSASGTVLLTLTIDEGQQYRMGQVHILASKEAAQKLYAAWQLPEGAVFDSSYIEKYMDANRQNLTTGFTRDDVQLVRDCPKGSVDVVLLLDPMYAYQQPPPKEISCEQQSPSP